MWIDVCNRTPSRVGTYKIRYHYSHDAAFVYEGLAEWDSEIFITKNWFIIIDQWYED